MNALIVHPQRSKSPPNPPLRKGGGGIFTVSRRKKIAAAASEIELLAQSDPGAIKKAKINGLVAHQ